MLGDKNAVATIAVKDVKAARKFYEGKLGLKLVSDQMGNATYKTGNTTMLVYKSDYAGTNKATSATWVVDDVEDLVKTLKAKGVVFEHYDLPGLARNGDIHSAGKLRLAWFKDPDGNIHHIISGV
ncbi:MAG: VOC family protein [Acidobacteriota bacterium]|nr:VOC family protein [Acidobacteriota bacterium]